MNDTMITIYERFQWLDFEKFNSDAEAALTELGLQAFPHLINILSTSLWVIRSERERESVIDSTAAYFREEVTELHKLRTMVSALSSANQLVNKKFMDGLVQAAIKKEPITAFSLGMSNNEQVIRTGGKVKFKVAALGGLPWNIDEYDHIALLILQQLDFAYEFFHAGNFDQALQNYSVAKQFHDFLLNKAIFPTLSPLAVGAQIGRLQERHKRSASGGDGTKAKSRREREAIKPIVLESILSAPDHHRKNPNRVFVYMFGNLQQKLADIPPVGFKTGFQMSEAAFKDVVKEIGKENPTIFQKNDKTPSIQKLN